MPYNYNRAAFSAGRQLASNSLLKAYCSLVLLELGLKDHLGLVEAANNAGHDVPQLLTRIRRQLPKADSSIASQQTQLRRALSSIRCQGKAGTAQATPAQSYPYLRYVRHSDDWPSDSSSEGDLAHLATVVDRLLSILQYHGVNL